MLAELLARGVELDENGNRLFTIVKPHVTVNAEGCQWGPIPGFRIWHAGQVEALWDEIAIVGAEE